MGFTELPVLLINLFYLLVQAVSFVMVVGFILGSLLLLFAVIRGISKPLWRLGLGLSRRKILIVASSDDGKSLRNLVEASKLFSLKRVEEIHSRGDIERIESADVILFKYSGSEFELEEILEKAKPTSPILIYAGNREITDHTHWSLMDEKKFISVCNLRGRLLNDLLTLMMTSAYAK